jgi:diguanylate cyclase (GGDEF)-like protein
MKVDIIKILKYLFFSLLIYSFVVANTTVASIDKNTSKPKKVLILYSFYDQMPWQNRFKNGLREVLTNYHSNTILYEENLDATRFSSKEIKKDFLKLLLAKYSNESIDLIVTESGPASDFLSNNPAFLKDIPRFFINSSPKVVHRIQDNKQNKNFEIKDNISEALNQIQDIFKPKKIFIVGESKTNIAKQFVDEIKNYQHKYNTTADIEYLVDLPTEILLKRVKNLPLNSVIFYSLIFQDENGKKFIPYDMAREITSKANVPVFSHWNALLGSGIAGGYMLSSEMIGKEVGKNIISFLSKNNSEISKKPLSAFQQIYDWKILKSFHINLNNLPKSSIILNKPESFYSKYYWQINLLMFVLIVTLIIIFFWIVTLRHQVEERTKELKKQKELAEKLAVTDQLTGLLNRHAMEMVIHEKMTKYSRTHQPMSLLMMDIDHFKHINDTYGHHIGDEVLKYFASILKSHIKSSDYFARWGGEEFIILSLNKSVDEAIFFAEELRHAVDSFEHENFPSFTVSIGVAEYKSKQTFECWYEEVDKLLYEAKEKGRNRVCSELN